MASLQSVDFKGSGSYQEVSCSSSNMADERFSIIDTRKEGDTAALDKVKGQLSPQGFIANLVDKVWNRGIAAMFSTEQRQLNAARNLLAKPSQELTKAMNHFASLSSQVQRFGGAAITLDNVEQYAAALKAGMVLVEVADENAPNGVKLESQEPQLHSEIGELRFARLSDGIRITDLEGIVAGMITRKTPMTLTTAAKAVAVWNKAIQTAGRTLSDAQFRGLVTQANANAEEANANKAFVEANTVTTWAQIDGMGQEKFVNEAVAEFSEAVKGIDAEENNGDAVKMLHDKIEQRAAKIAEITGGSADEIKQALLHKMNGVDGFKETLMSAQDSLLKVVKDNQSHEFLAREQIDQLSKAQGEIIDSVKNTIEGSLLKGEAAIIGTFAPLLVPETTIDIVEQAGQPELLSKDEHGELQGQFVDIAKSANAQFNLHRGQLNTLLTQGNRAAVEAGQGKAEAAIEKLDFINKLISEDNRDQAIVEESDRTWFVDTEEGEGCNQPIQDMSARAVAEGSKEAFLTMVETLAGETDADAAPTLLFDLIKALGYHGQYAVLPIGINYEAMFIDAQRDRREVAYTNTATGEKTEMLVFSGEKPVDGSEADRRPIGDLRAAIKEIRQREEDDRIEKQQREIEEARLKRESNPTRMMKMRSLFSSRKPFASRPSSDLSSRLQRNSYTSSIDEEGESLMNDPAPEGPQPSLLARVGSAIAAPFRWIGNQTFEIEYFSKQRSETELSNRAFSRLSSVDSNDDLMGLPSSSPQDSRRLSGANAAYVRHNSSSSTAARPNSSMNSSFHGLNTDDAFVSADDGATFSTFVGQSPLTQSHQPQHTSGFQPDGKHLAFGSEFSLDIDDGDLSNGTVL